MVTLSKTRLFALAGFLSLALGTSTSAQEGLQLFHKMQDAMGGAEKIAAIRDLEERVHAQTLNNEGKPNGEERKRTRWIRPNYLRIDQKGKDNNTYTLYFDGTQGWEILPDRSVLTLVGDELTFARQYLSGMNLKIWLHDRDSQYHFTSPAKNVIRISGEDGLANEKDVTLDPISSLPLKETEVTHGDKTQQNRRERQFEDWRPVQGLQFPHRISLIENGTVVAVITVDEIKLDSDMKPSVLATKPSDLSPAL